MWDSDTLAAEAKGLPNMTQVLTGRYVRYPAKYYEMRRDRVTKAIAERPDNLALYDDLAVALDQLGDSTAAIQWMEKKKAALTRVGGTDDDRYRYHANLGTFHAHRWFRAGRDLVKRQDITAACEHIAEAIRINPQAHFGRERFQLMYLEWVRDDVTLYEDADAFGKKLIQRLAKEDAAETIKGLQGIIVLGNAWENIDVHVALAHLLEKSGSHSMAIMVQYRVRELSAAGKKALCRIELESRTMHQERMTAYFAAARQEADEWLKKSQAYMVDQMALGKHPDTHPDFWAGYRDNTKPPEIPGA